MIDTMGYGIYEMHLGQARRYFPLPDYDLSEANAVKMTIYGKIVDPAYSRMLIQKTDLSLGMIFALDRVQKKLPIDDSTSKALKAAKLIEGRKPNFYVSATVAAATSSKADYIRTRAQDDVFYAKMIKDYLVKFGSASRKEIDKLLWNKLSDALDEEQKQHKINNLITNMRRSGKIANKGTRRMPVWTIAE